MLEKAGDSGICFKIITRLAFVGVQEHRGTWPSAKKEMIVTIERCCQFDKDI